MASIHYILWGDLMSLEKLLERCGKHFGDDNYLEVIKTSDEILEIDRDNEIALGYKSESLYLLNEYEDALNLVNHAIDLYPNNWHFLKTEADILTFSSHFDDALGCYERIFEMGIGDDTALAFIRMDYEMCFRFKIDFLIDKENYVQGFQCYMKLLEASSNTKPQKEAIDEFKRMVKSRIRDNKEDKYYVLPSSVDACLKLTDFLKSNGFTQIDSNADSAFMIDVVKREFSNISSKDLSGIEMISESKFYDKINFYPQKRIVRKKLLSDDGTLLYEGYTLDGKPFGLGTAYFENGKIYREGVFDIKGIAQGKEYYPSGQLRFEGQWTLNHGYGPNAPKCGKFYSRSGDLLFSGKFKVKCSGIGWPRIQEPKKFKIEQEDRPKIIYFNGQI